ncbi:surfactin synthase thioesterase subunit [Streptomyces canus]|uniref:Surfactin synthase thioesterase subunit n=1 Tax=Streptomyces canus TaxID=58343 RepID=A0AAW8F4M6_9ACTN|nr:thioesterase domain-containing protein [Streptomyces canus]MDQ0904428.1 surfactin synthase thioesterase subunit [Streptomyces canus]
MSVEQPVRLHCFAHSAEGVGVFDDWAADVGAGVEPVPVLLPGCAQRRTEPRITTHAALLADVLPSFTESRRGPYALYGAGLGAMAARGVTRALLEAGLPGPAFLAVGAWPPPRPPAALPDVRRATDAELLHALSRGGAVPAHSDEGIFLRAMLPVLRADLELAQDLEDAAGRPSPAGPLTTPVLVVVAPDGPYSAGDAAGDWHRWTDGPVRVRTVPGPHAFGRGGRELPRLLGRACRIARRLVQEAEPVG